MKVLIGVHHFLPRHVSGSELHALHAAQWLRKCGHDASIITIEHVDRGPENGLTWTDEIFQDLPVRRLSFNLARASDRFRYEYDNPWIWQHLNAYLAERRPDIFHVIGGYLLGAGALRAAQVSRVPTVITLTDYWFLCSRINMRRPNGAPSSFAAFDPNVCARCKFEEKRRFRLPARVAPRLFDRLWHYAFQGVFARRLPFARVADEYRRRDATLIAALRGVDAIICPSRFVMTKFAARGIPLEKMHYNPHGVDDSHWLPVIRRVADGVFRIGYLGQIDHHKGIHLLIEAFKSLRSAAPLELVIYGDEMHAPPYVRQLRARSRGDARIQLMGRYDGSSLRHIMSGLDVVVIPSTWNEIGPLVMYEAFRHRVPVVASDIPNMSDEIRHQVNGLLFTSGDSSSLAQQLQRLISNPQLVAQITNGIPPVRTLDDEMTALSNIYCSLLKCG